MQRGGHTRNDRLDVLKFALAACVVFIHFGPNERAAEIVSSAFVAFAVPTFIVLSLHFTIVRLRSASTGVSSPLSMVQIDRLVVPYVAWTCVYVALRLLKYRLDHAVSTLDYFQSLLFGGSAIQLWFIPFLLLCDVWLLAWAYLERRAMATALALLVLALVYCYAGSDVPGFRHALPKSLLYVGVAYATTLPGGFAGTHRRLRIVGNTALALVVLAVALTPFDTEWIRDFREPAAGYAIVSLGLMTTAKHFDDKRVRVVLGWSYGIYLAHHLFAQAVEFAASRSGHPFAPFSISVKLMLVVLVIACCGALITLLRLQPWLAYVFLGEKARTIRC